ncbi:MAG TPA: hypothetical protein VG842_06190, partial [Sediminibacterium sp.]|nr:hypothetical protein [Sediminibacterium sp.]
MSQHLENFIRKHREAFDTAEVPEVIWKNLEQAAPGKEKHIFRLLTRMQAAAILLVLVNVVIIGLLYRNHAVTGPGRGSHAVPEQVAEESPITEQTLDAMSKLVEMKQARLKEIEKSHPHLYKTFSEALEELNTTYRKLEKEYPTSANADDILEAMIQNLRLQQELLNQQLSIFQSLKKQHNESPDKN